MVPTNLIGSPTITCPNAPRPHDCNVSTAKELCTDYLFGNKVDDVQKWNAARARRQTSDKNGHTDEREGRCEKSFFASKSKRHLLTPLRHIQEKIENGKVQRKLAAPVTLTRRDPRLGDGVD